MSHQLFVQGPCLRVHYFEYKGRHLAREYLNKDVRFRAKLMAIAKHMAEHGESMATSRGHPLAGDYRGIFELKPGGHRVMGFRDGADFYLTNGAPKKPKKQQIADYEKALEIRNAHTATKAAKRLK